jgi:hypothetical protein
VTTQEAIDHEGYLLPVLQLRQWLQHYESLEEHCRPQAYSYAKLAWFEDVPDEYWDDDTWPDESRMRFLPEQIFETCDYTNLYWTRIWSTRWGWRC